MSDESSGFALRFISGKYQGGEVPLPKAREFVIGRGGELDIVLVEDMVSRKHAKLTLSEGKIVIQDLGSTNGTFVNGEKVRKSLLKEGDRVLIGTSILKLISAADSKLAANASNMDRGALQQMLDGVAERRKDESTAVSGSLEEMPIPDLLQMLSNMKKNGTLAVTNGEDSGRIYIREGGIYYAMLNDNDELGPMKALFRMFTWQQGEFRLGPPSEDEFMLELEESTEQLVMEAARQSDEYLRIADKLPEMEDMLSVPKPLNPALADLGREELEVIQLVHNLGFFQSVLDTSPYTDLKTAEIIQTLLEREYVFF